MQNSREPSILNASGALFAIVFVASICYLAFTALQGSHGLVRLVEVREQESELSAQLSALVSERAELENKVRLLSNDSLDLDLLDERARKVLTLGSTNEIMVP
ncbi:MAG: septum formation initiator family protein [Pseudomonadota bacterium]